MPLQGSRKVADIGRRLGVTTRALYELLALDDDGSATALGLGDIGPLPEAASIEAMGEAALRTIRPTR